MVKRAIQQATHHVSKRVTAVVQRLLADEASSGKFLLIAAAIALIAANSPWAKQFADFWHLHLSISLGGWEFSEELREWINGGLMALFFLVAGLEVKREMVLGELRTLRAAALPVVAAAGGMILPAALYLAINAGQPGSQGWGIPMTTDIAFAVGVLALVSRHVPASLKLFLLTLAIIDDIGAVTVIALFYTDEVHVIPLILAGLGLLSIAALQWLRLLSLRLFIVLGIIIWAATHASGVHASIAGALLGLSAPIVARSRHSAKRAIAERLERMIIPVSTFFVIPLFALANAGVAIRADVFQEHGAQLVGAGIAAGLVLGKLLGITGATWLMVRFKLARLPEGVLWHHIIGVGLLGGIGFTLSLFMAELAFAGDEQLAAAAKVSIFGTSLVSAGLGLAYLRFAGKSRKT